MSGVIDETGQQWEHCCQCGDFVEIEFLRYAYSPKWPEYDSVDLCKACFNKNHKRFIHLFTVIHNWKYVLWNDLVSSNDDASLEQYKALTPRLIEAAKYGCPPRESMIS